MTCSGAKDGERAACALLINDLEDRVRTLEQQHEDLVTRNKLLRDRPDLPAERLAVYEVLVGQIEAQAALIAELTEALIELRKERHTPYANSAT